jgi:hypothetical protein
MRWLRKAFRPALAYPVALGLGVGAEAVVFGTLAAVQAIDGRLDSTRLALALVAGGVALAGIPVATVSLNLVLCAVFRQRQLRRRGDCVVPESIQTAPNAWAEVPRNCISGLLARLIDVKVVRAEAVFASQGRQWVARNNLVVPRDWGAREITVNMVRVWFRPDRPEWNWVAALDDSSLREGGVAGKSELERPPKEGSAT